MKISELMEKLEKLRMEHGDLEVEMFDDVYGFGPVEHVSLRPWENPPVVGLM